MNILTPSEAVAAYGQIGKNKTMLPAWKALLLGVLAGAIIAFGGAAANTAAHGMESLSLARLASGLIFPFGLGIVVALGAELFTGNCLIVISVLERKASPASMLKNWALVYAGNLAGAVLVAFGCVFWGQLDAGGGALALFTIQTAAAKCGLGFVQAAGLGILCNLLVCMGVLMACCGKDAAGRIMGAYLPVALFVVCGFEHCIANMYVIPAGLLALANPDYALLAAEHGVDTAALTWGNFLLRNLLPVTLGNIVGGAGLGALMWACHRRKEG